MSVHTILLDFSIDADRMGDTTACRDLIKQIQEIMEKYFSPMKFVYDFVTEDGFLTMYTEKNGLVITVRLFNHGLITINIEYFKQDFEQPRISFETMKTLENSLRLSLGSERSKHLPPIKRGRNLDVYLTSSDERLLEYDIDKVHFDKRSKFQSIQIVHSKSLGNMLVLDELQNISEADLIYTETLMQRGIEKYEGKEIVILGGGDGALLYELLKEKPKFVYMLEIDEIVMNACNTHLRSICGDVLEQRKTEKYEILVCDCMVYLKKFFDEGKKFDYVFGDLTDIPISDTPTGEIWDFIRMILEKSFAILKPDGKFMTHGNGLSCPESLRMYETQLEKLKPPVKFEKTSAYVPSFMEEWQFYQVSFA